MGSLPAESYDPTDPTKNAYGCEDAWAEVGQRLDSLKAVLPDLADLPEVDAANIGSVLLRVADTTEELRRRVIRDRIQRASLQELMQALLRSQDTSAILTTLTSYLKQVLGAREILLLRASGLEPAGDSRWEGYRTDATGRSESLRNVDWAPAVPAHSTGNEAAGSPVVATITPHPAAQTAGLDLLRGFAHVLPLIESTAHAEGPELCLGYLCVDAASASEDEEWNPQELARWVAGMLETLRHREEMERANVFRRQLLEAMEDGVLAVDQSGRVLEMNVGAQRYLPRVGISTARSRTGTLELDDLDQDAPGLVRHLKEALENRQIPAPRELILRTAERRRVPVNVAVSQLRGPDDLFQGLVVNLTDLTPVRAMEQEIDRLDRLAALGRFAAGVAHEIRNPLAGIGAGVEYMARRFGPNAPEQSDITYVTGEIRRLNQIVTDLLDYTHPRPLDRQWVSVRELLGNTASALDPLLKEAEVRLHAEGPGGLKVCVDSRRLGQVLINLVKNAIEAAPRESQVSVLWGASKDAADTVRIIVRDEGEGMSEEQRRRALEPFFTTKGEGTGLGLYLSHSIIEQHGGRLLFGANPGGKGTSVTVELPSCGPEGPGKE